MKKIKVTYYQLEDLVKEARVEGAKQAAAHWAELVSQVLGDKCLMKINNHISRTKEKLNG